MMPGVLYYGDESEDFYLDAMMEDRLSGRGSELADDEFPPRSWLGGRDEDD